MYYNTRKQRACQVGPQQDDTENNESMEVQDMENEVIEERPPQRESKNPRNNDEQVCDEKLETKAIKELIRDMLIEIVFIYPTIICHLYRLINEKSSEFSNPFAIAHFIIFTFGKFML